MNNGRGWNRNGGGGWNRSMRFAGPPPPLFRGGMNFVPRGGPANFFPPVGPPMWRGGMGGGRRGARGGGPPAFGGRGGVNQRSGKFGPMVMLKNNKQWKNTNKEKKNRKDTMGKRLSEDEIGVTKYISDHSGFNGIIKSRYADFQVSEIDEKGEIAKLTDQKIPEPPKKDEINDDEDLLLSKYNLELLPTDVWDQINSISVDPKLAMTKVEVDVTGMSKEHRTKVHDAVKKAFGDSIVGSTVTTNDKKLIRFERYRKGVRIDKRVKWIWPGEFVHFIVHKENCDTMEVASRIAERLNLPFIKPTTLGYSGTKDRRAKSSQWFSLRKVEPRIIAMACKDFRDIHVGNFRFSETHLKLGMLKGNRFRIALRNVQCEEDVIEKACNSLRENGFINYYGLQRFGTRSDTPTYSIGLKLLQGNIQEAIDSILEVRPGPLFAGLTKYKETRSAAQAYKLLKRFSIKQAEGRLLRALSKEPNDLLGAFNKLPRNTRLLYGHSYQSLIWNKCVSERIHRFGLKPAVGDLVLADPSDSKLEDSNDAEHALEEDSDDENTDGAQTENAENAEDKPAPEAEQAESQEKDTVPAESNGDKKEKPKTPVKVLTEEDIASGRYSILDVIMPLPGHHIDYPPNMKEYFEQLLTEDGIPLDMVHKIRCFSMSGAYRFVVVRPDNLSWRCVRYTNPFGDLILSDHDELTGKALESIVDDGKFKALLLDMSLPSSSYATMALRELLRVDTSGDSQAQQNDYHREGEDDVKTEENNGIKTEEEDGEKTEEEGAKAEEGEGEAEDGVKTEEDKGVDGAVGKRKLEVEANDPEEVKKVKTEE